MLFGQAFRPRLGDGSAHGGEILGDAAVERGDEAEASVLELRAEIGFRLALDDGLKRPTSISASVRASAPCSIAKTLRVSAFVRWSRVSVIKRAMVRADGGLRSWAVVMRSERRRRVAHSETTWVDPAKPSARRQRQSSAPL